MRKLLIALAVGLSLAGPALAQNAGTYVPNPRRLDVDERFTKQEVRIRWAKDKGVLSDAQVDRLFDMGQKIRERQAALRAQRAGELYKSDKAIIARDLDARMWEIEREINRGKVSQQND